MDTYKLIKRLIFKINVKDYNDSIARKLFAKAIANNASIKISINGCGFVKHCTKYTCLFDITRFIEEAIAPAKLEQIIKFYIFKYVKQD